VGVNAITSPALISLEEAKIPNADVLPVPALPNRTDILDDSRIFNAVDFSSRASWSHK